VADDFLDDDGSVTAAGTGELTPGGGYLLLGRSFSVWSIAGVDTVEPRPEISFGDDISVSGTTGVNRFTGSYELEPEQVSLGALAGTRMAGSPEAMDQEQRFFAAFAGELTIATDDMGAVVLGDHLTLVPIDVDGSGVYDGEPAPGDADATYDDQDEEDE